MTHSQLVAAAKRWLFNQHKCCVVLSNYRSSHGETPDLIGWNKSRLCIIGECKASRGDFWGNLKKPWMRFGIGDVRYFFVPAGLVDPAEVSLRISRLPQIGDSYADDTWGIVYVYPSGRTRLIEKASFRPDHFKNLKGECSILLSALRKRGRHGA